MAQNGTTYERWRVFFRKLKNKFQNIGMSANSFYKKTKYKLIYRQEAKKTNDSIYLIYTMGKVASMSVLDAITKRLPHVPVFAMHYMSKANLDKQESQLGESIHWDNRLYKNMHTQHALKIRKCIEESPQKQIKIITVIREPLNQIISQIFQQLNLHDVELLKIMTPESPVDYDYPEKWCNEELKAFSGINILDKTFNPHKGYEVYEYGRFSLLVIRFEDINRVFSAAMNDFSSVGDWILGGKNKAENKGYAIEYRKFRSELAIMPDVIKNVYSSPFVRHFYTDEEITIFKKQWKIVD
ncbi:MAG: putative capsular polysaccharide synthesis family protein [Prevotella sp.]|jgi:hypothetical protein|nr:putative capsular polysaccharide synthesis family protein [Prevotella sp.]